MPPVPAASDLLYAAPATGVERATLEAYLRASGLETVPVRAPGVRVVVPAGADPAALAARIAASGLARSVEADAVVSAARLPDDPLLSREQRYLDVIGAPAAWDVQVGDPSVVIAVVDTGIDYQHPELAPRLAVNLRELSGFPDGVDVDHNGCPDDIVGCSFVSIATADPSCGYDRDPPHWVADDDEGHGSFVAGIVAAAGDNARGIAGLAWNVRLLPVKVLDCTATGRISEAAAGIRYAADLGADIINISFGTPSNSPTLAEAIDYARAHGAIVVASAGNDGRAPVTYPARLPGVVSVAASGLRTDLGVDYRATARFANFAGEVDLLAPGVNIFSTVPAEVCGQRGWACVTSEGADPDEGYAVASGSSFAAPFVAGTLALMKAADHGASNEFLIARLLASRQPGATVADALLLDVAAAVTRPLFGAGTPGLSSGPATTRPPAGPS